MSFDIRISLRSPNGYLIEDKTFKRTDEVTARDLTDVIMMLCDKDYFDYSKDYYDILRAVELILQGYDYRVYPVSKIHRTK